MTLPVGNKHSMNKRITPQQEKSAVPVEFSSSTLSDSDLMALPSPHKHKKNLLIVLISLVVIVFLLGSYLLISRYGTLYARTMRKIAFDYRYGEDSDDTLLPNDTSIAQQIAAQHDGDEISISAATMLFDSQGGYTPTLTLYDYRKNEEEASLTMETCAEYWLPTKKTVLRQSGEHCYKKSGDAWLEDDSMQIPDLYSYCFGIGDDENISLYQRYYSTINQTVYICEIWLMEEQNGDEIVYNTLYRYYDYDTKHLRAVRLLPSYSDNMLVFDISDYQFE